MERPHLFLFRQIELRTASSLFSGSLEGVGRRRGCERGDLVEPERDNLWKDFDVETEDFFGILKFLTAEAFGKQLSDCEAGDTAGEIEGSEVNV